MKLIEFNVVYLVIIVCFQIIDYTFMRHLPLAIFFSIYVTLLVPPLFL